jgi:hypothetical protein
LGLITLAENGFGWRPAFTNSDGSFFRWDEVSAWCSAPETLLIRTGEARLPIGYYHIGSEELTTIVDAYLKKYASESEVSEPDSECTDTALRVPDERDRIIKLLEAASSKNE